MIDVLDVTSVAPGVGYVYRWVNLVNGKMYIGSHCGSNPAYTASGKAIKLAFEKYGMSSFKREILYVGPEYREKEQELLLRVNAKDNPIYYNIKNEALGLITTGPDNAMYGKFGADHPAYGFRHTEENKRTWAEAQTGENNTFYGRKHTPETLDLIRSKLTGELNPFYGKTHSEETRKLSSDRLKGKPAYNKGVPMSDAQKDKLSEAAKKRNKEKVACPYCPKQLDKANAAKWHFDNCKQKKKE